MHFICILPFVLFVAVACDRSDGIAIKSVIPLSSELTIVR